MEAGGTFFAFRAGDVAEYFRLAGIGVLGGLRSASVGAEQRSTGPLAPPNQCKTQCVLRIWQKLYARFRDGLGEVAGERGVRIREPDQDREKWCQTSGDRQGRFTCTGAGMGNAERFGMGGGGVMTGKEKGVDREISIKQVRKQV